MARVALRRATLADVAWLQTWSRDPDVIACTTDDPHATVAFEGTDWTAELSAQSEVSEYFIAEVDGRPIGAMQICDPHLEPTHYWGEIAPNLRAVDIWIGSGADRNFHATTGRPLVHTRLRIRSASQINELHGETVAYVLHHSCVAP